MKFELSESIQAANADAIMNGLEAQLRTVAHRVRRDPSEIFATGIHTTFGSINRNDDSRITVRPSGRGHLLVAEVHYRPSGAFWVFFILGLFTWIFWTVPIVFYLVQKDMVKQSLMDVFKRIKDGHETLGTAPTGADRLTQLKEYAELKLQGVLTEDEFNAKKKQLLGV